MTRIIYSFEELLETVNELSQETRNMWLRHYLEAYLDNKHSPAARLEYAYRLVRALREYNIFLADYLLESLIKGEV